MLPWLLFVALKIQSLTLNGLPVGTYKQVALFVNLKTNKKQLDLHFPNAVPYDSVPLSFFFLAPPASLAGKIMFCTSSAVHLRGLVVHLQDNREARGR